MAETNRVRLSDLCSKVFIFLSTFRSQLGKKEMTPDWVRGRLQDLLRQQEAEARQLPHLYDLYRRVDYLLVATIDGVLLCSGWEHADRWKLLEQEKYHSAVGGTRFFDLMKDPAYGGDEIAEVFYLCIRAGFQGRYLGRPPEELAEVRTQLHAQLKDIPRDREQPFTPQAYAEVKKGAIPQLPIVQAAKLGILMLVAIAIIFVLTPIISNARLGELEDQLKNYTDNK